MTFAIEVLVLAPLAFHGVYGASLAIARPGSTNLPTWLPRLRRTASLATLVFVAAHVVELPLRVWTGAIESGSLFDLLSAHLSAPWHGIPVVALAYLAGVAATVTHFGLSLWAFFPAMGIVLLDGARTVLLWSLIGGGTLLFAVAGDTIVFFATGSRLLWSSPPAFVPDGPPAVPCTPSPGSSPKK
jgi:succinate dehydrogenase / fumarate reductase cytochrome b subunit